MKTYYYLSTVAVAALLFISGCKGDDAPSLTPQQETANLLAGTWGNAQVVAAPVPGATGGLNSLVLTFNVSLDLQPTTYSAAGATDYISSSGNWKWADADTFSNLILQGSVPVSDISIDQLNVTNLVIRFALSSPVGGRVAGIGEYTVNLTKQ